MGADLDHLSPNRRQPDLRRRLLQNFGAAEDAVLLLYAGRLVPEKNLRLLFDLLALLARDGARDYRLLIVGDGIERDQWERKCTEELPGRAFFFGHIRDKNVLADLYSNSDIFVHPNPREPFGIAPLEAMSSGLPLVAPNTGGIISYANMENAWTVNADVESFAEAVREAATNTALVEKKTIAASLTANKYRWENIATSFLELYEELNSQNDDAGHLPPPAFCSTPARGFHAALMRGTSKLAKRSFQLWSRLAANSPSRHRPQVMELSIDRSSQKLGQTDL
jgi:alpha-1,6-mannosyltransferase